MKILPVYILIFFANVTPMAAVSQEHCLLSPNEAICKTENVSLYVGPQSVAPGEPIFIAVETLNAILESSSAKYAIIIDTDSGQEYQVEVDQGLAYMEIEAPTKTGRLAFTAEVDTVTSSITEVLVHAGRPTKFELMVEKNKGHVFVSSSIITDRFGNMLDDGMIVDIELINATADVYSSLVTRIKNGRLGLHIACQSLRHDNSRIRARIGQVLSEKSIPQYICGEA